MKLRDGQRREIQDIFWWETGLALMINLTENKGKGFVKNNS